MAVVCKGEKTAIVIGYSVKWVWLAWEDSIDSHVQAVSCVNTCSYML